MRQPMTTLPRDEWHRTIAVNLTSVYDGCMTAARHIDDGSIINISSVAAEFGSRGQVNYAAAKAGMLGMARALAQEVGRNGVTVNCVAPGWIETGSSSEAEIVAGQHTPVGRPGTPNEVGHMVVFLASEEASYVTGQLMVVDGGNTVQEYKVTL